MFRFIQKMKEEAIASAIAKEIEKLNLKNITKLFTAVGKTYQASAKMCGVSVRSFEKAVKENKDEIGTVAAKFADPVANLVESLKSVSKSVQAIQETFEENSLEVTTAINSVVSSIQEDEDLEEAIENLQNVAEKSTKPAEDLVEKVSTYFSSLSKSEPESTEPSK